MCHSSTLTLKVKLIKIFTSISILNWLTSVYDPAAKVEREQNLGAQSRIQNGQDANSHVSQAPASYNAEALRNESESKF
jgi:hypothetical protein